MTARTRPVRRALLTLAGAAVTSLAPAMPAQAEPAFIGVNTVLHANVQAEVGGTDCSTSVSTSGGSVPVVENGGTATMNHVVTIEGSHLMAQVATGSVSASGGAAVTSANGVPRTIDVSGSGQGQVTFSQDGTGCTTGGGATYLLNMDFVLPVTAYLDLTTTITGRASAQLNLHAIGPTAPQFTSGLTVGFTGSDHTRVLLPAGEYVGQLGGGPTLRTATTSTGSGSASLHGVFTPVGAQLAAPAGPGGKYVSLPASATCSNGSLAARVTTSKKRVAKVRSVVFQLGEASAKVRSPKKGQAVSLPFSGSQPATMTAIVTLRSHHGRKPRVLAVSATYEACS